MGPFTRQRNSLFLFVFSLFVYWKSAYRTLPPGDSSDLILAAQQLGVAHPPGYPLLTILGRIWLCICPVSIAFSLNLLNAIIASAANYALYNTISVAAGRELPAIIGTLWFGFSKNVWEWNTQFENYALNNFLVASLLYVYIELKSESGIINFNCNNGKIEFSAEWHNTGKERLSFYLPRVLLLSGLALANNHQSLLIVVPLCGEMILFERSAGSSVILLDSLKFFLAPLALYLYLPLSALLMGTVWKWGYCQSPFGFLLHILQMDYGSSMFEDVNSTQTTLFGMLNHFFLLMHWEFNGILGFIFAAIGFVYLIMQRKYGRVIAATFIFSLLVFASMASADPHKPLNTMLISRAWLQPSIFFVVFISLGVNALIEGVIAVQKEVDRAPEIVYELLNMGIAELLVFIILLVSSVRGFMYNDRSTMSIFERFSHQTLTMLPKNALVLSVGESLFTGMEYFQIVQDYRSDIDLVDSKMLTHHWWLANKQKKMDRVNIPKKEYGDGFFGESNQERIIHDRINFCKANQQRMIFICGADKDLEEIERTAKSRDSEFEVIPWGHCDQIFIKSNYTFGETDLAKAGSFIERHNTLIKSSGWFLAPPFSTRIPLHLWEFEINNLMWHMKTRLARAAFDAGEEALDNGDIDMALINFDQSYKIYRTEQDAINLNKPKEVRMDEWVPPEWHRNMALIHTRLASHGGPNFVGSYKIARIEMAAFLESAKRLRRRIPWKLELQKIKVLDGVIASNGAKTIADVEKELEAAENIGGADESDRKQHLPYTNDL